MRPAAFWPKGAIPTRFNTEELRFLGSAPLSFPHWIPNTLKTSLVRHAVEHIHDYARFAVHQYDILTHTQANMGG